MGNSGSSMTKNPFINACTAVGYVLLVVSVMNYGMKSVKGPEFLIALAMLSLFTLSAGVMAYIFVFQPLRMYLDGDKQGGVTLFLQTLGVFAGMTALVFIGLLTGLFS